LCFAESKFCSLKGAKTVKFFSANLQTLRELYVNQLRMLVSTEQQIIEALPKMIEKATDTQLQQAFQSHLQETKVHAQRLNEILKEEGAATDAIPCAALKALVAEAEDLLKDATDNDVRDAALITAAQRVEHYEIAVYGTVRQWATILGKSNQAMLLDKTVKEEGHADHLLTSIAGRVNVEAEKVA
jgi:ferritin-like metal-binding protein YciE